MKLKIKVTAVILFVLLAFGLWIHNNGTPSFLWNILKESEKKEYKEYIVQVTRQDGSVDKLELETYLEGVVGSEMPASYNIEALKAQSVAARTYALQHNLQVDDTTRTQVYHDDEQLHQIWGDNYDTYHKKIKEAIQATRGNVLTYQGQLISAVFFSSSCGKTGNSEEYWGSEVGYLRSVDSSWDSTVSGYEQTLTVSDADFYTKLGFANTVSEVGTPIYYASGYVNTITIDRIVFSGKDVREKLGLRSSSFTIAKVDGGYNITSKGYGHGLGMSQKGAQYMAEQGESYEAILKHYYTGVEIVEK